VKVSRIWRPCFLSDFISHHEYELSLPDTAVSCFCVDDHNVVDINLIFVYMNSVHMFVFYCRLI